MLVQHSQLRFLLYLDFTFYLDRPLTHRSLGHRQKAYFRYVLRSL
jgi:hypothetical protein